ncbi:glycosyl hydrolase 53 family protein [Streptomyces sp. UP1A-1]|nr:glycosyl hydrolase 53 family protein [Streptomyces sp. UP1A-1]
MLFPYGTTDSDAHWGHFARFVRAGYEAVKAVSPATRVILHLDDAGNMDKYEWFFSTAAAHDAPYDVIGSSYYPFWTRKDIPTVCAFFDELYGRFGKKIMVMETGVNWTPLTHEGVEGQLTDNGPVPYPETPQGQKDFLTDLFAQLKRVMRRRRARQPVLGPGHDPRPGGRLGGRRTQRRQQHHALRLPGPGAARPGRLPHGLTHSVTTAEHRSRRSPARSGGRRDLRMSPHARAVAFV